MIIRQATGGEILELWGCPVLADAPPTARFFYREISAGNAVFWAIEHDGKLIGELYAFLQLEEDPELADGSTTAYLCAFRVEKAFRGQGLGSRLMEHALAELKTRGFRRATIGVDDARNERLYRRLGFLQTVKTCDLDPCARDAYMRPLPDPGCLLLARELSEEIGIAEIPPASLPEFWDAHIRYLTDDGIIEDEEDAAYFSGEEYRGILEAHMRREQDRQHMVWFVRGGARIGAASYCTYQSEGGKCFILDFWVFPDCRGGGTGHGCFAALERYTKQDGARYYELNSTKPASIRFWKSLGFTENGTDEYDMPLFVRKE